jgi:cholesterol oxidase
MPSQPDRRQMLVGAAGAAGLGMFGLLGGSGCARHIRKDPAIAGRTTGPFRDWSLISSREALFAAKRTDVVIVGSGYGGAVTAARLAASGAKVFVLERGQEWLPGDFPESLDGLLGADRATDSMGLFDLYMPSGSDMDIIAGSGVGGTSLINAAISSRPEPMVFEHADWPEPIRAAHRDGSLATYFDQATAVLSPNQYTGPDPEKVAMHRRVAGDRPGGAFSYLPLNVSYRDARRGDPHRPVETYACRLCGNCTTGCNFGAKGTLQTNYLPMARANGASIFAGVEVDRIERRKGGWRVHYTALFERDRKAAWIDADHVVVAAGSLGSTHILMRSAAAGLRLSPTIGTRVSANGDMMGFCYAGNDATNLVGERQAGVTDTVGNALMSYIDYRGEHARGPLLQDRFLLLEGTIPVSLGNTVAKALAMYSLLVAGELSGAQHAMIRRDLEDPTAHHPDGALAHSTLYLACGHDDSGGRYVYRSDARPKIVWKGVGSSRFVETISAEIRAYTELRGGHYIANPRSTLFGGRVIAPHPLGGCPMADDIRRGVVDHVGRVFDPGGGVYPGLHVLDGSIIPRSLAATPLLTICALAERAAARVGRGA